MKRGQIRRLAAACGVHESDVVQAIQKGRVEVDRLVEGALEAADRRREDALGDAWPNRIGVDPSRPPARRVYAEVEEELAATWMEHTGIDVLASSS